VRKRLALIGAAVLVVLVATGGAWWWHGHDRTTLQQAVALAPHDAERLSWTDWAAVRHRVGVSLSADSSRGQLRHFLDRGYDADLTSASALVQSAPVLQTAYGFSPATAEWELFSQSTTGAVVILRMPDGTDYGRIGDDLEEAGYTRPSSDTGVWQGGEDLLNSIGPDLTPELQFVALDAADHLILTSDSAAYLAQAVSDADAADGPTDPVQQVVDASGTPLSAAIYDGTYTCSALAMGHADSADQDAGEKLLQQAGRVNPVEAFAMSMQPSRHVRVAMAFESSDQARTNADTRATLAAGPAPGQGGDFGDRFSVHSVTAKGDLVLMDLIPKPGAYVLSDLSSGPLLFATC
jgi:hypothetical protein